MESLVLYLGSWIPRVKPWILGTKGTSIVRDSLSLTFKSGYRPPRIMTSEGPKP